LIRGSAGCLCFKLWFDSPETSGEQEGNGSKRRSLS
jgi:hypothetical protein